MAAWRRLRPKYPHPDEVRMTLGEHLEELRSRLIRALVALFIGAVICYVFSDYVMAFLTWPIYAILRNIGQEPDLGFFHPAENFTTFLKVSLIVGFIISAPYSLIQIWGFVAAGLYPSERKWVHRFVPVSIVLFFVGAAFLLVVVSPLLLRFLLTYQTELPDLERFMPTTWLIPEPADKIKPSQILEVWPGPSSGGDQPSGAGAASQPSMLAFEHDPENPPEGVAWFNQKARDVRIRFGDKVYKLGHLTAVERGNLLKPQMRIGEYVMFILQLAAAFGIGFQVPVVVAFISMIGIATAEDMRGLRRHVWFGMAIMAAVITPPDVSSMLFLLVPMALLYEVGLIAARFLERERETSA